jgi:hypothetical protein
MLISIVSSVGYKFLLGHIQLVFGVVKDDSGFCLSSKFGAIKSRWPALPKLRNKTLFTLKHNIIV